MTILQELFYGNIVPNDDGFDYNSGYGRAMRVIADNEEKLLMLLKDVERRLFVNFRDAQSTLNSITAEEKFIQGFKMGALIMIEVLKSQKESSP